MRLIVCSLLISSLVLTTGCGSGEDAIDGARNQPNSFGGVTNPLDDFSPGSTGDSSNVGGLADNEVRITLEVPAAVAPPEAEPTRRNLRIVQPDDVQVYYTNETLQVLGSGDVSLRRDSEGFTIVRFNNGQPLGPDVVIEATYGNTRMRALAADADQDVKVNPFSEYLVRNTLNRYTPSEFQRILDCVNDAGGTLCLNKYVWSTLSDQVHDFEIRIPGNANLEGALTLLSERADFASYVASMSEYAKLGGQSSGKISARSADYNSVFLGIELGQTFLESSLSGSGQWGTRLATEEKLVNEFGTGYVYPALTLTSFDAFNIRVTSLATDIPYHRETLIHQQGNEFFDRDEDDWQLNTHSSSPGAATLLEQTRLLAGRALYQSITGTNSARTIGWTRNPYYLDAYTSTPVNNTTGPDRVLAGYFSAGKAIELEADGEKLKRGDLLEEHYLSVLELHLLRKTGFNPGTLDGRDYNTVYLATRYNGDAANPARIEAGIGRWQIDSGDISQTQTYTTLNRDSSGAVSVNSAGTRTDSWTISSRTAFLSTGEAQIGRLNLDIRTPTEGDARPDLGIGASTPDGSLLAFNLDDDAASDSGAIGDGLLVAAEQSASAAPATGSYRLQGVALGMADGVNALSHFENGTLEIVSSGAANLNSTVLRVRHEVANETVSSPAQGTVSVALSYNDLGNGQVSFSAGALVLEGFVTADQEQFFLRYRNTINGEEQLGLVLATRLPD